jgi:hypothetical protein
MCRLTDRQELDICNARPWHQTSEDGSELWFPNSEVKILQLLWRRQRTRPESPLFPVPVDGKGK